MIEVSLILVAIKPASITILILVITGIQLAWRLSNSRNKHKVLIESVVALPPTVLGFYILMVLSPDGFARELWSYISDTSFSFTKLATGSVIYFTPFIVQPLQPGICNMIRNYGYLVMAESI